MEWALGRQKKVCPEREASRDRLRKPCGFREKAPVTGLGIETERLAHGHLAPELVLQVITAQIRLSQCFLRVPFKTQSCS